MGHFSLIPVQDIFFLDVYCQTSTLLTTTKTYSSYYKGPEVKECSLKTNLLPMNSRTVKFIKYQKYTH